MTKQEQQHEALSNATLSRGGSFMLETEQNTRAIERRIRRAFREKFHARYFETTFEHGQWWVLRNVGDETKTYSVCDTERAFDFEELG